MSVALAALLICGVIAAIALVTAVLWVRSVDWRFVWHEIPNYFYLAWDAEKSHFGISCLITTAGLAVLGIIRLAFAPDHDPGLAVTAIGIAALLSIGIGLLFLLASIGDFVWHLLSGNVYEPGLDFVREQKALGDAAYAAEDRIHAALIEDKGFVTPKFED